MTNGLVCFDLDGVIADSRDAIGHCMNLALLGHGAPPVPLGAIDRFVGPPLQETFLELLTAAHLDPSLVDGCIATYRQHYVVESLLRTGSYAGIQETLTAVSRLARVVVVTSKPLVYAAPLVRALTPEGSVESVFGPTTDLAHEPKTDTLARALGALQPVRLPVIMVGDRRHDVAAALANGAVPVGVLWGFGSREELETAGAVHIAATPEELTAMLEPVLRGQLQQ